MNDSHETLLALTAGISNEYLDDVSERWVGPRVGAEELRAALKHPLTAEGTDPENAIRELVRWSDRGIVASTGPRFFGFVVGGAYPAGIAADWLTSTWDQNAGLFVLSPLASVIEEVVSDWIRQILELPESASVGFVTGCQMANLTCLAAARHAVLRRVGWNVEDQGLNGAPRIHIVLGGEAHVTIYTSLRMLGFGTEGVTIAEADEQGRMRPEALREALRGLEGPTIVCAQAGNVNSGACDPFTEIVPIAREAGAWIHVDGAFGLWARASAVHRSLVDGVEGADSWATDAHKWLNVPQDSGVAIVRDSAAHRAAMTADASYLQKSEGEERDEVDWVPDFSRRARAFPIWAVLRTLGRDGLTEMVERCCAHARRFASLLSRHEAVSILNDVVLNQALVRFDALGRDGDELTRAVISRIQNEGTLWLGGTSWHGRTTMRISVSNWRTTEEDLARSVESILAALEEELA